MSSPDARDVTFTVVDPRFSQWEVEVPHYRVDIRRGHQAAPSTEEYVVDAPPGALLRVIEQIRARLEPNDDFTLYVSVRDTEMGHGLIRLI